MNEREFDTELEFARELGYDQDFEKDKNNKKKLRVYVDVENQRHLIDNSAAYELGLISYEAWLEDEHGFYLLSDELLTYLSTKYEIVYQNLINKKLKVYVDVENKRNLIDNSAAYELELMSYEEWMNNERGYYELSSKQLDQLSKQYEVIYVYFNDKIINQGQNINEINIDEHGDYKNYNILGGLKNIREQLINQNVITEEERRKYPNNEENDLPKKK